jgi:outer membrane protein TolC
VDAAQSLFQGFRKTTAVERSVVSMKIASSNVDEAQQTVSEAIEIALADRDNSLKARDTARTSLRQARENLDTVKMQYQLGDVSRIEFTEGVSAFVDALGSSISAFYGQQRAEAQLFSLLGLKPVYSQSDVRGLNE